MGWASAGGPARARTMAAAPIQRVLQVTRGSPDGKGAARDDSATRGDGGGGDVVAEPGQLRVERRVDLALAGRGGRAEAEIVGGHELDQLAERGVGTLVDPGQEELDRGRLEHRHQAIERPEVAVGVA